ncbi:MAG: recombination protein O N-terminal domain-containing protein [Candidatus Peregrinibacteria bacterium]
MSHARTFDCLVLASYDVGEADRFVVVLTRETGRLAARVPGARRMKSRLAALLPLTHLSVELKETTSGHLVTGIGTRTQSPDHAHLQNFLVRTQCSELLLALLSDGEPVPEIFDALSTLLCKENCTSHDILAFSFRLLALLGVLPESTDRTFASLSVQERDFVHTSAHGEPTEQMQTYTRLNALCSKLIQEHATRTLRASDVMTACIQ